MEIAAVVLSVILAVAVLASAIPKVQLQGLTWSFLRGRGMSARTVRTIGVLELTGVVGLMAGLFWPPIGIVATVLLIGLFGWALWFHFMHGDFGNPDRRTQAAIPLGLLALTILTMIILIKS